MVESHSSHRSGPISGVSTVSGISRTVLPQVAATACKGNVRYMFRARGITTKWRTLERQEGGREAEGEGTKGRWGF